MKMPSFPAQAGLRIAASLMPVMACFAMAGAASAATTATVNSPTSLGGTYAAGSAQFGPAIVRRR